MPDRASKPTPLQGDVQIAVYAGTFDPLTYGHLDMIRRAADMYGKIYIAVSDHGRKKTLFSQKERMNAIKKAVSDLGNVEIIGFTNLLYQRVAELGAGVVVRGLRMTSDFEYEFQMAAINRELGRFETVFLMARAEHTMISSSNVKEVAILGGDVRPFVPPHVAEMIEKAYADKTHTHATRYAETQ